MGATAHVAPQHTSVNRYPRLVDRHDRCVLATDGDRRDGTRIDLVQQARRHGGDEIPPLLCVLGGCASVAGDGGQLGCAARQQAATEGGNANLEPRRPEIDDKGEVLDGGHQPAAPRDCWASIMSTIIILMNSSASVVIPPATPP